MATDPGLARPGPGDPSKRLACRQCRARKVKCDRQEAGCGACYRLSLPCSFVGEADGLPPPVETTPASELTQAGIKRRRSRHACDTCRAVKAKCSGTQPCSRCHGQQLGCTYRPSSLPTRAEAHARASGEADASHTPAAAGSFGLVNPGEEQRLPTPAATAARPSPVLISRVHLDKGTKRQYIDAYFQSTDPSGYPFPFLHRATTVTQWNQGRLDETLVKALCASGLHSQASVVGRSLSTPVWMQEVQQTLLARIGNQSIGQLQSLMLLIDYRFATNSIKDVWMLLPIAARIAFTKRLNHEHSKPDPIAQECLRRLMWSIFWLDKLFSGGVDDLVVCPSERLHIRLPCADRDFQHGLASKTPYLNRSEDEDSSRMHVLSCNLRLFSLRERILRYTKRVIQEGTSPYDTSGELSALEDELQIFRDTLPDGLKLSDRQLMLMGYSPDSTGYMMLHTRWYLSRSDLYRFLVVGVRESVSAEAMEATPESYRSHCQAECLDSCLQLCDLWSAIYQLDSRRPINDRGLVVSIYQCIKKVDRLTHLLPADGEHSLPCVRRKLTEAVSMACHLKGVHPWIDQSMEECESLLPSLGLRSQPSSSRESPDLSRSPSGQLLRSKHSLIEANLDQSTLADIPDASIPHESTTDRSPEDTRVLTTGSYMENETVHVAPHNAAGGIQALPTPWHATEDSQAYSDSQTDVPSFIFEGEDFMMPWATFNEDASIPDGAEGLSSLYAG